MNKAPGTGISQSSTKSAGKKTEVISVACQTDIDYFDSGSSLSVDPSLPNDSSDNEMVERSANTPSSNAADQRAAASSSREAKQQPTTSEPMSEGTISMTIGKFSTLADTMCSGPRRVQGVPWRIMVMPKQHVVQKKQQKCMGFFLQCCPEKVYSDAWSCKADAEMRLMSKKGGVNNFVRKTSHVYTSKENDWGYSCFMTWADVLDENQGYIKDDKITLEITVRAEAPKNLMTREEFVKAIDQWFNLAEMQMSRGMIDLSLEANAQGLKFCKDKDDEMKIKLEEQKDRLVNKKLLDSITRIENHGGQPKSSETLKPTSLRQALTGAQKTIVSKNGKASAKQRERKTTLQQIKKKKQETAVKQDRQAEASTSDDGEDEGEDEDYSDYYNEDEEAIDNQLSEHDDGGSIRGSSSSLEESTALGDKVENCSQTEVAEQIARTIELAQLAQAPPALNPKVYAPQPLEQANQPQANPRREKSKNQLRRRGDGLQMHLVLSPKEAADEQTSSESASSPDSQQSGTSHGASGSELAALFVQEISDENSALYKKLLASNPVKPEDQEKIDAWCQKHFGEIPKDMSACGLTIGLCAVNARYCAQMSKDFRKLISETFKEEYKTAAKCVLETERQMAAKSGQSQPKQQTKQKPPEDFTIDLAKDVASGRKLQSKMKANHAQHLHVQQQFQNIVASEDPLERIASDEEYIEKTLLNPVSAFELNVEQLIKEIGNNKFNVCLAERLKSKLDGSEDGGFYAFLTQLFNYFRTLVEQRGELEKSLEISRVLFQVKNQNGGFTYKTQLIKDNEKRLQESEALVQRIGNNYQEEVEKNKKLSAQLTDEQSKLKAAIQQIETLTTQLKDARNNVKKAEKKSKQEETKNATLLADKLDLEDKLKASKKEAEQLKKKSVEDRTNAKKQKDRDTETIRRLEQETSEKEAEKEREKNLYEEKLRDARTKENKAEKERKQAQSNAHAAIERARTSEAAQILLMHEIQKSRFEKAQEEIQTGLAEAEKNLKRAHNTLVEQDVYKKNLGEWKAVSEELEKIIKETKIEYENAADTVKKGHVLFSHLELPVPTLPALPKTIRPPPVQVVQPSTSVIPPPTIVTPPAGVIGQPRVSASGAGVIGQSASRSQQVNGPSSINGTMPGPSSYNSMKMNHDSPGQSHSQATQQITNPASSMWNWSSPLETLTGSVFRSNSTMDHVRQPQPQQQAQSMSIGPGSLGMDWGQHDDFNTQSRQMYSNQQGQVNWANAPGWQRPASANIPQQQQQAPQQYRPGLPPYNHHYQ